MLKSGESGAAMAGERRGRVMEGVWCMAGAAAESSETSEKTWEENSAGKGKEKCKSRQSEQRDLR